MPPAKNCNSLLPGSSSSVSLNETPNEEINYDSDISEDDHAIAEGGDDDEYDYDEENDDGDDEEDEEEPDEGFAVEVNTLTGSTFNIMIHPSDTVEVLKTRIAFQEGISPADQNILLDSTTGCSNNATVQELNIDRNSKLTLVTNVASGVPFKTITSSTAAPGMPDSYCGPLMGGGREGEDPLQSSSPSFKLAPTIKRNYHNSNNNGSNNHCSNNQQKHSSSSSSSSLRLPKILTTSAYLDKNSNIVNSNGGINNGGSMHKNGQVENHQQRPRLDEKEWMKSLFNKVVNQNEEDGASEDRNCDDFHNGAAKIVIDIDSTNGTNRDGISSTTTTTTTAVHPPHGARVSTRYIGTKYSPEEDGSILVVQGDDGVILIIQKNTDQVLEDTYNDNNNNSKTNRFTNHENNRGRFGQVGDDEGSRGEAINGRIGRLGRYTQSNTSTNTEISVDSSMRGGSSYRKSRYQQDNKLVHDKIKENAVTLEKMRQVRSMMAQQKRVRSSIKDNQIVEEPLGSGSESTVKTVEATKTLEFPKISEGMFRGSKPLGVKNGGGVGGGVGYRSRGGVIMGGARKSAVGGRGKNSRSINSSKMSLNRLIAELYLQTKRKDRHTFQPGQPPYTDQQLLRYVQLKTAILLDEQKKNKTEPCSKCQLDDDWSFNEASTYLVPTVVMNRYKRFANGRNSKSLDKGDNEEEDVITQAANLRRKSLIPVVVSSKSNNKNGSNPLTVMTNGGTGSGGGGGGSYIPRLVLVNREREAEPGVNRNNPSSVATTASTISGRSSSSMLTKVSNGAYRFSSSSSSNGGQNNTNKRKSNKGQYDNDWNDEEQVVVNEEDDDDNDCMYDTTIIITNNGVGSPQTLGNNGRPNNWNCGGGGRPTFKVNPKMYYSKNMNVSGRTSSSRPGSSKASSAAKKGSVRCQTCKKKVGIACRYQCRCGLTFCSVHRYPETHECTFDYKTEGRNKLRESNPVIVARKIQEI